jgi:hypothetical protein
MNYEMDVQGFSAGRDIDAEDASYTNGSHYQAVQWKL